MQKFRIITRNKKKQKQFEIDSRTKDSSQIGDRIFVFDWRQIYNQSFRFKFEKDFDKNKETPSQKIFFF